MGACYSKGSASAKHLKIKAPKVRKHGSNNKEEPLNSPQSGEIDERHDISNDEMEINDVHQGDSSATSPSIFPSLVSCLEEHSGEQESGIGDKGVAPSDSGIESIGLIAQEETMSMEEPSNLSRNKLERLSRGSCHKCGNFKLDDNALTALLSNTYCLCGPRQAGKPSINPDCQTHGLKRNFKRSVSMPASYGESTPDFQNSPSPVKSSLKKNNGERREKTLRISLENNLDQEQDDSDSVENVLAPLAKFDSSDNMLNDSVSQKRLSRRSLLSEILDITDSICKCDFYSNEYCVGEDKSENGGYNGDINDTLESLALSGSSDSIPDSLIERNIESPSKKSASLSKFVTFAHQGIPSTDQDYDNGVSGSRSCPLTPVKGFGNAASLRNSMSETSSGVDVHSAETSGSVSTPNLKGCPDMEPHISACSYEAVDCTEDDLASVDMDSLSRVTSLSYCSIRQLLESTEDLVEPLDTVRRMTIDGEDCVIIPTQTYKQMQSDLTMLKEQLVCLSSLLQEENESRNRKSFSFYSDQDTTPTRKIQFRSQEFVDMLTNYDQ